jgi:uncharacterized protein YpmS
MKVWQVVVLSLLAVLFSFFMVAWAFGLSFFGLQFEGILENKRTEVIRNTNQYKTTQQQMLLQYAKEYQAAEAEGNTAQAATIKAQMQSVAATLDPADIPPAVTAIIGIQ